MAHLTLAGVSDEPKRLLLVDDQGVEFTLDITPSLRAALRGDASRLGQLEIQMDSTLRPRDIQARIRAGETPESVAEAAQTSVDKILPFVGPVLAERQHVAERAQRSTVRRASGEGSAPSRTLGEAVETHLRSCNVDPSTVEWDAWRREDGRWSLVGVFSIAARAGTARFTFDAPGNYVVLDNEDARWLIGERVAVPAPARDDLQHVRRRRLSSVGEDELPLGDDAIELVSDPAPAVDADDLPSPIEAFLDEASDSEDRELREDVATSVVDDEPDEPADPLSSDAEPDEAPARRAVQKKRGRASVPSWDEIMFGGPSEGDRA